MTVMELYLQKRLFFCLCFALRLRNTLVSEMRQTVEGTCQTNFSKPASVEHFATIQKKGKYSEKQKEEADFIVTLRK